MLIAYGNLVGSQLRKVRFKIHTVYKITNKNNNKVYFGSSSDVSKRLITHFEKFKNIAKCNNKMYNDMIKNNLTIEDFDIEIIKETDDIIEASRLESYLIRNFKDKKLLYNTVLGAAGRRVFSEDDIIFIRNLYQEKKLYITEAYEKYYKNKVTFRAFKKVWHGETFKNISQHVYTAENKKWHFSKGQSRPGDVNGRAIFSEQEVIEIRKLKDSGLDFNEVRNMYNDKNKLAPLAFKGIWNYTTWKHIK